MTATPTCESCGTTADVRLRDGSTWCYGCNHSANNLGYDRLHCTEYRCRRQTPILIRQGGLTGRWYAITDWKHRTPRWSTTCEQLIEAMQKHDITDELTNALLDAGWTPPEVAR
ncbi:MAG: hypothetical protein M3Y91_06700 [Actinomycetota bacterium]|nr:hypothetical protein [Actinomycetota bacterium]